MANIFKKIFTKEKLIKFFYSFVWLIVLLIAIDAISKWAVVNHFGVDAMNSSSGIRDLDEMIPVIPHFLYIGGSINPNAAFSFGFSNNELTNRIIFISISVVMSAGLIFYYVKEYKKLSTWFKVAISLMIAGAIGNLIDRAFYWKSTVGFSGVVDWIQVIFFYGTKNMNYFAMFNIADSALVVGVAILIVIFIVDEIKEAIRKGKNGEYKYSPNEIKEMQKDETNQDK